MPEPAARTKGKKPPSFPHVHPNRAKKFKKAWVDKVKIKSQWKAQKRKEALAEKSRLDIPTYREEHEAEINKVDEDRSSSIATCDGEGTQEEMHPASIQIQPSRGKRKSKPESVAVRKLREDAKLENHVRELTRQAYSRSNLHTFRSDPLKKCGASGNSRGEKGKGQPDMRLRMSAMLAKIKRDYA